MYCPARWIMLKMVSFDRSLFNGSHPSRNFCKPNSDPDKTFFKAEAYQSKDNEQCTIYFYGIKHSREKQIKGKLEKI
jgi:hypothetical protein